MTETITSPQNEKLKLVRRLADRRGREREGLFATEGEDLLSAGIQGGRSPRFVLALPGSVGAIDFDAEILEVEPGLLAEVSTLGSGTRLIAVWPLPEVTAPIAQAGLCVYLHGVADPGNVGTIVRSAAALAGATVVLGPGCADPYSPKASRASMGALFAYPPAGSSLDQTPEPRLALVAHGGADLDDSITAQPPRTLCLGAEREGLDDASLALCGAQATIPLHPGAESLNVAASAAIALQRISSAAPPFPADRGQL